MTTIEKNKGGRPAGSINTVTQNMRHSILEGGVLKFMLEVVNGEKTFKEDVVVTHEGQAFVHRIERVANLAERTMVAKALIKKVLPDMKEIELKNEDGEAFEVRLIIPEKK